MLLLFRVGHVQFGEMSLLIKFKSVRSKAEVCVMD